MCELCVSTAVHAPSLLDAAAGNHVLWRLSHSEKLPRVKIRLGLFCFVFVSFFAGGRGGFGRGLSLLFSTKERKSVRLFRFFFNRFLFLFCLRLNWPYAVRHARGMVPVVLQIARPVVALSETMPLSCLGCRSFFFT